MNIKLNLAEEVENAKKEKDEEKQKTEKKEEPTEKKEDVKEENVVTEEKPEAKSETLVNGHTDPKVKLVNGDSNIDNDSTAVNTPGSSTPLMKPATTTPEPTDASLEPTVDILRLETLHLQKLVNFLESEFSPIRKKLNDLLENNDMKFDLLWCLFRLGSVVTFKDHESSLTMAGEVPPHSLESY